MLIPSINIFIHIKITAGCSYIASLVNEDLENRILDFLQFMNKKKKIEIYHIIEEDSEP